jgi:hypothetical protein
LEEEKKTATTLIKDNGNMGPPKYAADVLKS